MKMKDFFKKFASAVKKICKRNESLDQDDRLMNVALPPIFTVPDAGSPAPQSLGRGPQMAPTSAAPTITLRTSQPESLNHSQQLTSASATPISVSPAPAFVSGQAQSLNRPRRLTPRRSFPPPGVTTEHFFEFDPERPANSALIRAASVSAHREQVRRSRIQIEGLTPQPGPSHLAVQITPPSPAITSASSPPIPFPCHPNRPFLPLRPRTPTPSSSRRPEKGC